MENSRCSTSESVISQTFQSRHISSLSPFQCIRLLYDTFIRYLIKDWHGRKYIFFAALLLLLTVLSTTFYYLNYPHVELNPDTPAYLHVVERIQTHPYLLVDTWRLPIYPLLIVFTYAFTRQGNLTAVSIVQAGLFVITTLEIYCIAFLLLCRAWLAFLIGLLVGTNLVMLSYIKPIMSEGLAMCLLTTLVLAMLYFLHTLRVKHFWLVVLCYLPLLFTRPEWEYLPVLLFAYLLLVAVRRGVWRHLLSHMLLALVLIYGLVGIYIGINTFTNHYPGFTAIENFNWLGKVLQYHMWNEASPQYAQDSKQLGVCVAHIDTDPYHVLPCVPSLSLNDNARAGAFARDIILHHPVEFFLILSLADHLLRQLSIAKSRQLRMGNRMAQSAATLALQYECTFYAVCHRMVRLTSVAKNGEAANSVGDGSNRPHRLLRPRYYYARRIPLRRLHARTYGLRPLVDFDDMGERICGGAICGDDGERHSWIG